MPRKPTPFEEKYIPEPNSGCWLWTSAWEKFGYGQATNNARAHRLSWELHFGPIPDGMRVCHKCDTRPCVNPQHLFLGSDLDNVRDKVTKGRHCYGTRNGKSKLTADLAVLICTDKRPAKAMAIELGVCQALIYHVRNGRIWGHATGRTFIERGPV